MLRFANAIIARPRKHRSNTHSHGDEASTPEAGDLFAYAGLWDTSRTDTGERIESVTHITLPANGLLGEIHS
jgi:putative SOS response-associated peptidase YedK